MHNFRLLSNLFYIILHLLSTGLAEQKVRNLMYYNMIFYNSLSYLLLYLILYLYYLLWVIMKVEVIWCPLYSDSQ